MVNDYCPTHDKVFLAGGSCPGCDPNALGGPNAVARPNHCAIHDQIYAHNGTCPGCDSAGVKAVPSIVGPAMPSIVGPAVPSIVGPAVPPVVE